MCVEICSSKISIKIVCKVFSLQPFKYTRPMNGLNKWFSEDHHSVICLFSLKKAFLNELFPWLIQWLTQKASHKSRFSEGIVFDQIISLNDSMILLLLSCYLQESFLNKSVSNRIGLVFWRNYFNKLVHWMIWWVIWMTHKDATGVTISVRVNLSV